MSLYAKYFILSTLKSIQKKKFSPSPIFAGSLESANSSVLAARRLFKDFGGEKIRILC